MSEENVMPLDLGQPQRSRASTVGGQSGTLAVGRSNYYFAHGTGMFMTSFRASLAVVMLTFAAAVTSADRNELREAMDLRLRNDLRRFADARESMVHLFGLQTYADIMSSFAAGERYINRVWSASADGYDEEAATYLEKAAAQFADARAQLSAAAANS